MYELLKEFFLLNFKDYENLGWNFPVTIVLFGVLLAVIAATIIINYRRTKIENIIRALTRRGATSEDGAKTLGELGLNTHVFRRLLSVDGQLTKIVGRRGEKKYTYEEYLALTKSSKYREEKINFDEASFYIKEEAKDRAEAIIAKGATSPFNTVIFCLMLVAIFVCIMFALPELLSWINDMLAP